MKTIILNNEDDFFAFQLEVEEITNEKVKLIPQEYPCKASWEFAKDKLTYKYVYKELKRCKSCGCLVKEWPED
jgi:hypothetical protein